MFETVFIKNEANKTLTVERQFAASKDKVWAAWTDNKMLEKWWAPEPYKAVTKSFSFTEGGKWHYYMEGPTGDIHWSMMEYETINPKEDFTAWDSFADEQGNRNTSMPVSQFKTMFSEKEGRTRVVTVLTCQDVASLNRLLEMGMAEGIAMGHRTLDTLLAA